MNNTEKIILGDGKYTVIMETEPFCFYALRHNKQWEAGQYLDNLHLAMFQRIRYLERMVYNGQENPRHK